MAAEADSTDRVGGLLQLEAAGALPPDKQAAVDELRRAGQFPAHEVTPDDPIWSAAEQKYGLPGGILHAIQGVESGGQPDAAGAKSKTGVTGLMQVTLGTGEKYGLTRENRTNPYKSIDVAAQILRDNLTAAGGDVRKAVALYGDHNEKGYADKVLSRWQPTAAQTPPVEGTPTPTPAAHEAAKNELAMASAPGGPLFQRAVLGVGQAASRRLAQIASDYDGLAFHWGLDSSPDHFKQLAMQYGIPGADQLETGEPTTFLQQLGAASGAAALTPATAPLFFVAPSLIEAATDSAKAGDAFALVSGGVQAIRHATGLIRGIREVVSGARAAGEGAKTTEQVLAELKAARGEAATQEMAQSVAAAGKREAIQNAVTLQPSKIPTPTQDLAKALGVVEGQSPTALEVGEELLARGREEKGLVPGQTVGTASLEKESIARSQRLYKVAQSAAAGVPIDTGSPALAKMHLEIGNLEKDLSAGALRGRPLTPDERDMLAKLRSIGGTMQIGSDTPQDLGGLMTLYGDARRIALDPGQYPILTGDARNRFYKITSALGEAIRTDAATDERIAKAWDKATEYTLRARVPAREITGELGKSGTLLSATLAPLKDPETMFHVLSLSGPDWGMRYRQGALDAMIRATKGSPQKLAKVWEGLQPEVQAMMAAPSTPRSAAALAKITREFDPATADRVPLSRWTSEFRKQREDLQPGVDRVTSALRAISANYHKLPSANSGVFGKYHLARAALLGYAGSPFAVTHLGTYALMRWPGLIQTIFTVPPQSVRFSQGVASLNAMLTPYAHRAEREAQRRQLTTPIPAQP